MFATIPLQLNDSKRQSSNEKQQKIMETVKHCFISCVVRNYESEM